jgi:selenocysteine lyase/cysteine desulfurase
MNTRKLSKDKGLLFIVDGAHGPGSTLLNLSALPCDFYASCGHKWMLGPKGTGFLYIAESSIDQLDPVFSGGLALKDMQWGLDKAAMGDWAKGANRFDFATQNVALYHGLEEAVVFLEKIGMERVEKRSRALAAYLQERLMNASVSIEMHSPTEAQSRGPMIGFKLKNQGFKETASNLRPEFRIREVPEAGFDILRVSCHIYNNEEEINAFIQALENL